MAKLKVKSKHSLFVLTLNRSFFVLKRDLYSNSIFNSCLFLSKLKLGLELKQNFNKMGDAGNQIFHCNASSNRWKKNFTTILLPYKWRVHSLMCWSGRSCCLGGCVLCSCFNSQFWGWRNSQNAVARKVMSNNRIMKWQKQNWKSKQAGLVLLLTLNRSFRRLKRDLYSNKIFISLPFPDKAEVFWLWL